MKKNKTLDKTKGMIIVEPKKCLACRTCEVQCALAHSKSKELIEALDEKPLSRPRVKVEAAAGLVMPLQCRHCEDAPCVKVCPTKAIERKEEFGPVVIVNDKCIGCKWCMLVCPFGAISMDMQEKVLTKCDLCFERLEQGEYPACVVSCPTGAIDFKTMEEISSQKRKDYLVKFKKGDDLL